jgi:phospholipid/cholesterol/gamma-HCH transport system substrate-binding protein
MAVKATEVRSGIFVVLALLVLSILMFTVGNFRTTFQTTARYMSHLPDAKFLKAHDAVTYGGFRVGEIKRVEVSPEQFGQVKVTIDVERGIPVKADSILVLKQDGMLGPKYIEISPGSPQAPRAESGATLAGKVIPAITDLSGTMEAPLAKLDTLLDHLNRILGTEDTQKNIAGILAEARTLLVTFSDQIQKIVAMADKTGQKSQDVLSEIQATVHENRAPLASTLKNVDELTSKMNKSLDELVTKLTRAVEDMSGRMQKTADQLDLVLRDTDQLIVQNNKNIYETIRAFRDTAYHMEQATKRIRANPSILLFGAQETPEELRRTDETEIRQKGRARRYDKEEPK